MDRPAPRPLPWKSWSAFTSWAQDFSLKQKVLGGFLGVVVLVGIFTSFIGTRLARETIMDRARRELQGDLSTASFILKNSLENLQLKIRLWAGSERVRAALAKGNEEAIRNRLAMAAAENDMDFLSMINEKGQVVAQAYGPEGKPVDVSSDSLIKTALEGKSAAGMRVLPAARLARENPALAKRLGDKATDGIVMEAAQPLMADGKVAGVLYGGILLNNNDYIVNRISREIFRGETYGNKPVGEVTIFQASNAISTTLRRGDGLPLTNLTASPTVGSKVLTQGELGMTWEDLQGSTYLAATEPLFDLDKNIVGAIQVATLERPISSVADTLVATFSVVALFGALLMGAISYFLVKWINRPLEQMLHAAKRAAEGDLSHAVPVFARDEIGELAATFNLMIRNLAESQRKLEEWGKQLASKVAEQVGELDQAREQVARVKKLASLEKMADGMAHLMAHISDPMLRVSGSEEISSTSRVLLLDSDEKVLDVCERILVSEGFGVKVTTSVQAALRELENEFWDVVVADIDMPDMGGKELLKEIKYRQPEVQVILTAPFKSTEVAIEAVKMGAYDYIPKPFGPHQILLMVYTALQTRQMLERTRRQHAEQRAETIFQRLPVAIALADKEHRVVYHNRAFLELAAHSGQEPDQVRGKTFEELFGQDPLLQFKGQEEAAGSRWLQLEKVGRTAKLYNFKIPEEDLRVLMLLDITETVIKDQQADVFKAETISKAQQVIHQQMRVAQEIAGLLGETTAETKAALFELIKLAREGEVR